MTRLQSLCGALGLASWRARASLLEYTNAASVGAGLAKASNAAVHGSVSPYNINEVGLTDGVLATLWRFGPQGAAHDVSAQAESHYFGADIAFVHRRSREILLYQAKVAYQDGSDLKLKSKLTAEHAKLLRQPTVTVSGIQYRVSGRVALYQIDHTPWLGSFFDQNWPPFFPFHWPRAPWWPGGGSLTSIDPRVGRDYYEEFLQYVPSSPCGVLAAPVPSNAAIDRVPIRATWPWEFDVFKWGRSFPSVPPAPRPRGRRPNGEGIWAEFDRREQLPEFDRYSPGGDGQLEPGMAEAFAANLREDLGLPPSYQLAVTMI